MKKVQKTLTGALATVMAAGMVPVTAMASTTDLGELHKAAYAAVQVAQKEKTQEAINEARAALAEYKAQIIAQEKEGLLPQYNTFSVLLDEVQQPILSEIVNTILAMKEAGKATQAEINAVRVLVDALPQSLQNSVNTWSSEVDKFQTALIDAAVTAVKNAETEMTQEAVDAAQELVSELATSVREAIKEAAANLQKRLDAVEVVELKITSLNVVKDGIEVEFEALKNTITDVTLEVVDNNGKTVEVQEVAKIIEGKSKQKFTFSKIYTTTNEKIEGVWTVNGVKVDMTEKKLVNTAVTGKNADGVTASKTEALVLLQNNGYISRLAGSYTSQGVVTGVFEFDTLLDKDGQPEKSNVLYINKISEVHAQTPIKDAAGIQEVIDTVNEEAGVVASEAERVALIKESATKPVQFFNALNAEGIERVNESWVAVSTYQGATIASYNNAELQNAKTLEDIQKAIDNQNVLNVRAMETKLKTGTTDTDLYLNLDRVTEVLDAAKEFINPELKDNKDDKKTIVEKLTASLNEQIALINVVNCDNTSALKSSLKKLSDASEDFNYDKVVYEEHMLKYLDKVVDADGKAKLKPANVKDLVSTVVTTVNSAEVRATLNEVQKIYTTDTNFDKERKLTSDAKAKLVKVFETLEANTRLESNTVNETTGKVTVYNKFDKSIIVEANLDDYKNELDVETVNSFVNFIVNTNDTLAGNTITAALDAVNANATDNKEADLYGKLSAKVLEGKVKGLVAANKAAYAKDFSKFTRNGLEDAEYIEAINTAIATVNARVEMLNATTVSEMASGLKKFVVLVDEVSSIIDIQSDIAEELLNCKNGVYGEITGFALDTINNTVTGIETATSKRATKIEAVNNAIEYIPAGQDEEGNNVAASVIGDSKTIAIALNNVDGTYSVADLASKAQTFVANSTVKNSSGVITGKVTYTSYAQVRVAIEKMMK